MAVLLEDILMMAKGMVFISLPIVQRSKAASTVSTRIEKVREPIKAQRNQPEPMRRDTKERMIMETTHIIFLKVTRSLTPLVHFLMEEQAMCIQMMREVMEDIDQA